MKKVKIKFRLTPLTVTSIILIIAAIFALCFLRLSTVLETPLSLSQKAEERQEEIIEEESLAEVPDVVGLEVADAKSAAKEAGFELKLIEAESEDVRDGYVISQNPEGGTKTDEDTITLTVSTGSADAIEMPDLVDGYESRAKETLEELGIEYEQEYVHESEHGQWIVIETDPAAGEKVEPGDVVTIYVSYGY